MLDLLALFVRYFGVFCVILTPIFATLLILQYRDLSRYANRARRRVLRYDLFSGLFGCVFMLTLGLLLFAASFIPIQGA